MNTDSESSCAETIFVRGIVAVLAGSYGLAQAPDQLPFEVTLSVPARTVARVPSDPSTTATVGGLVGSDIALDYLIDIDPATGAGTPVGPLGDDVIAGLAWDPNGGVLYATSVTSDTLFKVDPSSGSATPIGTFGVGLMHGLGYDSNNDVLYGITNNTSTRSLYRLDVTTGAETLVGPHWQAGLFGLAFDPIGDVMYASDAFENRLYRVDLNTGGVLSIGDFGAGFLLGVGLAYDPTLGLYATDNKGTALPDDELYRIDTATGAATLVGPIGQGNVLGLTFLSDSRCSVTTYCDANPNNVALIDIDTCDSASANIHVSLSNGPANQFVYLLVGDGTNTVSQPPGAKGDLCVVGGSCLGRYDKDVGQVDAAGNFSLDIQNAISSPCAGGVNVVPGATWNFQFWHRQPMGQPATFSQAISVQFL